MNMGERFFSVNDKHYENEIRGEEDYDERVHRCQEINDAVRHLAEVIESGVPNGRNKSIALTHLEDVQMRAGRGIFAPEDQR